MTSLHLLACLPQGLRLRSPLMLSHHTSRTKSARVVPSIDLLSPQAQADAARVRELHDIVLALSATVQELQPLAPRVATLEAEKGSLIAKAERLEEALLVCVTSPLLRCQRLLLFFGAQSTSRVFCYTRACVALTWTDGHG
jgi:hypothetical protein